MILAPETVTLSARGWRIDRRKAAIAGALCWIGFAVIVWLVRTERVASLDQAGLVLWRTGAELRPAGAPWLLEAIRDLTSLGGVLLRNLVAIGAGAALLFIGLRREATLLGATIALGWVVNSALKLVVGRDRPSIVPHLTEAGGDSFPSGHSFNSAVCYIAIALAFATISGRESVRATLILSAILLSMIVAWTRVWLGVHFPSDVVAGWLGGAGWAFVAAAVLQCQAAKAADATVH